MTPSLHHLLVIPFLALAACSSSVEPPTGAPAKNPSLKWEKSIAAFEAADLKKAPPQGAILFVGSSSITKWTTLQADFPDFPVINRGFGGCQLADVVYYVDRIVIPYHPRLIVIQSGGNDIAAGKSPEQDFADFKAFVTKVRAQLPDVRIAFMSLHPSPKRWAQREKQQEANAMAKDYVAAGTNLDYINMWDCMLGPDGMPRAELYAMDRLHNNAAGYKVRTEVTLPHLKNPAVSTGATTPAPTQATAAPTKDQ